MGEHSSPRGPRAAAAHRTAGRVVRGAALAISLAATTVAVAPGAALAVPVEYAFNDIADVGGAPAYDLMKGSITLDAETGTLKATIGVNAEPDRDSPTVVEIVTGLFGAGGRCTAETTPVVVVAAAVSRYWDAEARWGIGIPTNVWGYAWSTLDSKTISIGVENEVGLAGRVASCMVVRSYAAPRWPSLLVDPKPVGATGDMLDTAQANIVNPVTDPGQGGGTPVVTSPEVAQPVSDRDKDGVPDSVDSCLNEPGPPPTGCPLKKPASPVVQTLRLGARKVAVDRTIPRAVNAGTCPTKTKVVVTQGKKRLGAVKLATTDAGANGCRLKGNVKIKRYKKRSAVVVTISAPGLATTKQRFAT